ncbi:MAG: Gfo/Idh/MocA family oxidoreductase [Candidatus Sumerlaeaceae bacterium]|nr:Gfo/Idh/MocA family oxidoreductase [Candidatus Sumerlaeaceae bacterium]
MGGSDGKLITIGILGSGTMARIHAESIVRSGLGKVAAIFSTGPNGADLAGKYGAKACSTAAEILENPEIDAVVIATPTDTHAKYLRMAAAAHKHVLCEKPLVRTVAEADEMEGLFNGYDKTVAVGHVVRFTPEYESLKETVAGGKLGQIGIVRLGRCCSCPRGQDDWFRDFARSGGVMMDLMIHDLDFLEHAFGPVARVYGMRSLDRSNLTTDYALLVLRLKSGAIAHIEGSWAEPDNTFYTNYEVAGATGLMDYDSRNEPSLVMQPKTPASGSGPAGTLVPSNPAIRSPYNMEMLDFLDCVKSGKSPRTSLADGLRAVRLSFAAAEAIEKNAPVEI